MEREEELRGVGEIEWGEEWEWEEIIEEEWGVVCVCWRYGVEGSVLDDICTKCFANENDIGTANLKKEKENKVVRKRERN